MVVKNLYTPYFTLASVQKITQGKYIQKNKKGLIKQFILDSRKIFSVEKNYALFVAIIGKNYDGHDYMSNAYTQGIRFFLVEKKVTSLCYQLPEATIIQVKSSVKALQALAKFHRKKYNLSTIAITGSNGKTMVKEWLAQLLDLSNYVIKSPQSYNSQIGVPLSLLPIHGKHKIGIFEVGISMPGEMQNLGEMIRPDIGIFTNIGSAHDENFLSQAQKIEEKILLFQTCSSVIYCKDHTAIHMALHKKYSDKQLISWSYKEDTQALFTIHKHYLANNNTKVTISYQLLTHTLYFPFQDTSMLENSLHALVCCLFFFPKILQKDLQAVLHQLASLPMRLTLKAGMHGCQILDDTYNNDLIGLEAALNAMTKYNAKERMVILSDMLQTGLVAKDLYQKIVHIFKRYDITHCIGIGPVIHDYSYLFSDFKLKVYKSVDSFLAHMPYIKDKFILVKGARKFALEKIVDALQKKVHQTVLEVNLGALVHNFHFFRRKIKKKTKIMAMVKASAYGSSIFEVANLLSYHQVDYLGIAYTDEGILLRNHGIQMPIMVMNVTTSCFSKALDYGLEIEIYSLTLLQALDTFLKEHRKEAKVHIKIDTGMHRLGIVKEDFDDVVMIIQNNAYINIVGILSHLAAADLRSHDDYTHMQAKKFLNFAYIFEQRLQKKLLKHLLNTSGILHFAQYQLDMVRLGIGLYGVGVDKNIKDALSVVNTLKTVILQVKHIAPGDTVGYHRKGLAHKEMQIATIAIGYADGFSRALSNGKGKVWIQGHLVPIVGNICMDTCMIDITGIDAKPGDEVIIFGAAHDVEMWAKYQDTIAYEVFTSISDRVKRIYITV